MTISKIAIVALASLLGGCAAALVASTSDPWQKLSDAEVLYQERGRPLPAEKLIREAIEIFESKKDTRRAAASYLTYGELLSSRIVASREASYRRDGFYDRSLTFDGRIAKATEYYRRSIDLYTEAEDSTRKSGEFDSLTNIYIRRSHANLYLKQQAEACSDLNKAKVAAEENVRRNPGVRQSVPPGFSSVADYIDKFRASIKCV